MGTLQVFGAVMDNMDGSYSVTYTAVLPGDFEVFVSLNGNDVVAGPYPLMVLASVTDAAKSFARGAGLVSAVAGSLTTFTLVSVDQGGLLQDRNVLDSWRATIFPNGPGYAQWSLSMARPLQRG